MALFLPSLMALMMASAPAMQPVCRSGWGAHGNVVCHRLRDAAQAPNLSLPSVAFTASCGLPDKLSVLSSSPRSAEPTAAAMGGMTPLRPQDGLDHQGHRHTTSHHQSDWGSWYSREHPNHGTGRMNHEQALTDGHGLRIGRHGLRRPSWCRVDGAMAFPLLTSAVWPRRPTQAPLRRPESDTAPHTKMRTAR